MTVHGTYQDGHVELDAQVDWADGVRVAVTPASNGTGLREDGWHDSEAARAALLARIDAIEPLLLTPAEGGELADFSRQVRDASRDAVRRQMESPE